MPPTGRIARNRKQRVLPHFAARTHVATPEASRVPEKKSLEPWLQGRRRFPCFSSCPFTVYSEAQEVQRVTRMARWVARAGEPHARLDNTCSQHQKHTAAAKSTQRRMLRDAKGHRLVPKLGSPTLWVCTVCQKSALQHSSVWRRECEGCPAVRAMAASRELEASGQRPHTLAELSSASCRAVVCRVCGSYSYGSLRKLGKPCAGQATKAGMVVLGRVIAGKCRARARTLCARGCLCERVRSQP